MFVLITKTLSGNLHEAANYINKCAPLYAETLLSLNAVSPGATIAIYKVPEDKVRWMWGDLRLDMDRCPVSA